MKTIKVTLKGETDLLMNSPKAMLEPEDPTKSRLKKRDHKKDAEKVAYRNKQGLYVPAEAIKGCLVGAACWKKLGKYALKPIIAAAVRISPGEIKLNTNKYEVDLRTVVIQRSRVVKARPRISNWEISFDVLYNEKMISDPDIIKRCLEEGGERIGILDFRPAHTGEFGTFKIKKWKVN